MPWNAMDAMRFLELHIALSCTLKVRHLHPTGGSLQILLVAAEWGKWSRYKVYTLKDVLMSYHVRIFLYLNS